jgi:hypothetical protein
MPYRLAIAHRSLTAAEAIDLIEKNPAAVEITGRDLQLAFRPFVTLTLRLRPMRQ